MSTRCAPASWRWSWTRSCGRSSRSADVIPTFLGYATGYPATICVSVNDEIVHGIPGKREIVDGDIVSIDLGCTYKGFVADSAVYGRRRRCRRRRSPEADRCLTKRRLWRGIGAARGGARIGDIGHAIQTYVEGEGLTVVREYVGHGVGRQMHEDPQIPNYGTPGTGTVLRPGMVIAIEPMVNIGRLAERRRTRTTGRCGRMDGSLSAHFEHTLAITDGEAEVLTLP